MSSFDREYYCSRDVHNSQNERVDQVLCVCTFCTCIMLQLAGILNPYNGECLLEQNPKSGFLEFTRFKEFVSYLFLRIYIFY